jgi:tRNA (cmo5U34)-methyltransferase
MTTKTNELVDRVVPDGHWTFDGSVTAVFDNMLARSIPQYEGMRATVLNIALKFASQSDVPCVVDLGCSRGEAMAPLIKQLRADARFVGVEVSEPMLQAARERFAGLPNVEIVDLDLRHGYPDAHASITLAVLTLQFVPIEHRQHVLRSIFEHTQPGGALVLVEKVLGATSSLDELMVESHLAMKRRNGYTNEQIDRKRLALEGVLVPVTARWNEDLLRAAGFEEIDCFWRWMNFAGWIAVRS